MILNATRNCHISLMITNNVSFVNCIAISLTEVYELMGSCNFPSPLRSPHTRTHAKAFGRLLILGRTRGVWLYRSNLPPTINSSSTKPNALAEMHFVCVCLMNLIRVILADKINIHNMYYILGRQMKIFHSLKGTASI